MLSFSFRILLFIISLYKKKEPRARETFKNIPLFKVGFSIETKNI